MRKAFWLVVALAALGLIGCKSKPGELPKDGGPVATFAPPKENMTPPGQSGLQTGPGSPTPVDTRKLIESMPPGVNGPRPPAPTLPAANETVSGSKYTVGNSSIEVEGVCKISEDSVSCWKADGSPNKDLAERIEKSASDSRGYGGRFSMTFKKKNRLIVFKNTSSYGGPGSTSLGIMSVGDGPNGGGYAEFGGFNLQMPMTSAGNSSTRFECRSVAVDPGTKTTSARLSATEMVPTPLSLDAKKGASAEHDGTKLTVMSIAKGATAPGMGGPGYPGMMGPNGRGSNAVWTIRFKVDRGPRSYSMSPNIADAQGNSIQYVDKNGKPISMQEYSKWTNDSNTAMMEASKAGKPYRPQQPPFFPAYGGFSSMSGSEISMTTPVDPKYIGKFKVHVSKTKTVDLTKILLDPR